MHPEGGSWTAVRTHTPSKFSKVLKEPLAPIPLDRSKFRENGSQPPLNFARCDGDSAPSTELDARRASPWWAVGLVSPALGHIAAKAD
jgi:hypothetical protein